MPVIWHIKLLQGASMLVQAFSEVPFMFISGEKSQVIAELGLRKVGASRVMFKEN